jgi:hypothetical protein
MLRNPGHVVLARNGPVPMTPTLTRLPGAEAPRSERVTNMGNPIAAAAAPIEDLRNARLELFMITSGTEEL